MAVPRKRWLLAAWTFAAVFATLCVLEAFLAWSHHSREQHRDSEPRPHYTFTLLTTGGLPVSRSRGPLQLVLDPSTTYRNLAGQEGPWFTINSRGYRGRELLPIDPARPRIVVLGGSAAFGTGSLSDQATFAARLETVLDGAEVINAAVIGYTSREELALLRSEILDLQPALVLALDGSNDLRLGQLLPDGRISGPVFAQIERLCAETRQDHDSFLAALRTAASHVFRHLRTTLRASLEDEDPDRYEPGAVAQPEVRTRAAAYGRNLVAMDAACKQRGVRFVAVAQPEARFTPEYQEFVRLARASLEKHGGMLVDLSRLDPVYFLDDVHLTDDGNQHAAQRVAAQIGPLLGP